MKGFKRVKTKYAGVHYIAGKTSNGKPERIYYISYRINGKQIEEKAGRQYSDGMSDAKANAIRVDKIRGKVLPNNEIRAQKIAEQLAEQNKWTINRLWGEYKKNSNPKGIDIDDARYRKHIGPVLGAKEPGEIITLDITRFRRNLEKEGLKPGSVARTLEVLRRTINFGINQELISPVSYKIKLPKVNDEKTEFLTAEQFTTLWEVLENETNLQAANMMKLVLFTGLRRGELFKLKWEHIDFDYGFINIVDPKGEIDQKIPLNQMARDLLKNHERPYTNSPFVFPGKAGQQRTSIKKPVNRIRDAAGLPKDFRPLHGLRHTYASMLASSGKVDIYTLQKLLTHKDPRITQRYAHLVDKALKRGAEVNADIISGLISKTDNVINMD
jgi:integrase